MDIDAFATCPRGLESVLAAELELLGAPETRPAAGGVAFVTDRSGLYRANRFSRLAGRILRRVAAVKARDGDGLYRSVKAVDWPEWFDVDRTFRIRLTARRSPLRSLNFATLKAKDAVCDRFREAAGRRPDVDPGGAEVSIHLFLEGRKGTAYLDTTGAPLFQRGWRAADVTAPLRENLAAGMLALAGWEPGMPLMDPFCGGGTILIEAARRARGWPPGLERAFAFEHLADHDPALWERVRSEPAREEVAEGPLLGSDRDAKALTAARANAEAAGVADAIEWRQSDARELTITAGSGGPGRVVTNPPYGERLPVKGGLSGLLQGVAEHWRTAIPGWEAAVLLPEAEAAPGGLEARSVTPLANGDLPCRLHRLAIPAD
ncbi:class I SAM-dependent RNA methyltransferase [Thiohalospira sp.]|uniref:THUMP domain-containing class I SAM-dependent RNA methyltransferase n=1 Tax=Thiohalospira sp. TaxID=3080549 RepID=UPI003980AC52